MMRSLEDINRCLENDAPTLFAETKALASQFASEIESNLDKLSPDVKGFPKTFNDPCWGSIDLYEWEIAILDTPFLQRLRGIHQLGLAYAVYPSATHDRLCHSLGVVEASSRIINALEKNARHRVEFGRDRDQSINPPTNDDRHSIRLAALLHDIGHGPFSHASEEFLELLYPEEISAARNILRESFSGAGKKIQVSELIACLIIISPDFANILGDSRFHVPCERKDRLPRSIVARILGATSDIECNYLASIISGPIDADKIDYMCRDSFFTGLSIGLDIDRLIGKLEVITITEKNVPDAFWRKKLEESGSDQIHTIGISPSGLTAYEQMVVSRVLLYDRIYFHHKVRSGEAMLKDAFLAVHLDNPTCFGVRKFFTDLCDDAFLSVIGNRINDNAINISSDAASRLVSSIRSRNFYKRSIVFAKRYLTGYDGLSSRDQEDTATAVWNDLLDAVEDQKTVRQIRDEIVDRIRQYLEIKGRDINIANEDVIVDFPRHGKARSGNTLNVRTETGRVTTANLFFSPEKWSEAFRSQKLSGYVFCNPSLLAEVCLFSAIVFFERYGIITGEAVFCLCKTDHLLHTQWDEMIDFSVNNGLIASETNEALKANRGKMKRFHENDFNIAEDWLAEDPEFRKRLCTEINNSLPTGMVARTHQSIVSSVENFCRLIKAFEENGTFNKNESLDEVRELQKEIKATLIMGGVEVVEGAEFAGGESDLVLFSQVLVENKVAGKVATPENLKEEAEWQARRYAFKLNARISFVVVAYKPAEENALLPLPKRIIARGNRKTPEQRVTIYIYIPYGYDVPSKAKIPKKSAAKTKRAK